jgi:hypothetical protein
MDPDKPTICSTAVSGSTITITGVNFDPLDNDVWFTNANVTGTSADPRVRVLELPSTNGGTQISLTIPANAGPGDVLVKIPPSSNGRYLSNAFPSDLVGTLTNGSGSCGPFAIANISPSPVPALSPGTAQDLVVTGNQLSEVTQIDLNLVTIPSSNWTIVDPTTITIDLPQSQFLGNNLLTLTGLGGGQTSANFNILAPTTPVLQVGTGDPLNVVTPATGLDITVAGEVGELHFLLFSPSNVPTSLPKICLLMGNNGTQIGQFGAFVVSGAGWTSVNIPFNFAGLPTVFYMHTVDIGSGANPKFGVSNLQSITVSPERARRARRTRRRPALPSGAPAVRASGPGFLGFVRPGRCSG